MRHGSRERRLASTCCSLLVLLVAARAASAATLESDRARVEYAADVVPAEVAQEALRRAGVHLDALLEHMGPDYAPKGIVEIRLHGPPDYSRPRPYPHVDHDGVVHLFQFGPEATSHLSPLAHELVHVLRNPHLVRRDGFLEEAFASFMALRVDPASSWGFPLFGADVDLVAAQWMGGEEDLPLVLMRLGHGRFNQACRLQTYSMRTSFFHGLGRRYGDDAVVAFADAVARTGTVDFEDAFGAPFATLVEDWRAAVWERYVNDPDALEAAVAYREHPALRGIDVCTGADDQAWTPGPGAPSRNRLLRLAAELVDVDGDADGLLRVIAQLETLDVAADFEADRLLERARARWRLTEARPGHEANPRQLALALQDLERARDLAPETALAYALSATVGAALHRLDPKAHEGDLGAHVEEWSRRAHELDAESPHVLLLDALRRLGTGDEAHRSAARAALDRAAELFEARTLDPVAASVDWGRALAHAETVGTRVIDVELEELWRVGADPDDVLFGNLDRVVETPDGDVLALDTQLARVLVFDGDGRFLRFVGGFGQGPGELERPGDMFFGLGGTVGLVQSYPGRVVTVGLDGVPRGGLESLDAVDGMAPSFRRIEANADRVVVGSSRTLQGEERLHALRVFDANGDFLHELHRELGTFRYGGMDYVEAEFGRFHRRWSLGRSGRVAAAVGHDAFLVHVWNADGSRAFDLVRADYVPPLRTDAETRRIQRTYDSIVAFNPNSRFAVDDHHPAVVAVDVRDDDAVWIVDGHGAYRTDTSVGLVVRVHSPRGRFEHALRFRGDVDLARDEIHFGRERLYVVTEAVDTAVSATGGRGGVSTEGEGGVSALVCYRMVRAGARP